MSDQHGLRVRPSLAERARALLLPGTVQGFETLHDELGKKPGTTDLDALWKSLGVIYSEKQQSVAFDDHAPLAEIRRQITEKQNKLHIR